MKYSDEIREKALKRIEEIGVIQTSKEMKIADQTLHRWRKEQKTADTSEENQSAAPSISDSMIPEDNEKPNVPENGQIVRINEIEEKLKQELDDMRRYNQVVEETIDYLIMENHQLRERCERYLKALSLLAQ